MKTFLVFEPAEGGRSEATADFVRFVREKFYWSALFFTPLWLLWHALWLAFFGWLLVVTLIAGVASWLGLDPSATAIVVWAPSFLVAFEGAELRRRKLLRHGYRDAGVAIGRDLEEAERRFFADWAERSGAGHGSRPAASPPPPVAMPPMQPGPIVGLFPEPGARR